MISPEGKRISLFVNSDIPYIRAGSSKSLAHEDAEASAILDVLSKMKQGNVMESETAAAAKAVPGEEEEEEGVALDRPPDSHPREVPID